MKYKYSKIFDSIDQNTYKEIVLDGLNSTKKIFVEIRKTIPKFMKIPGFQSPATVPFKSLRVLINPILKGGLGETDTSRLIFKGWFFKRVDLVSKVKSSLEQQGYEIKMPTFEGSVLEYSLLNEEDIYKDNNKKFYRPGGTEIDGVEDTHATLLAFFMGWGVSKSKSEEEEVVNTDLKQNKINQVRKFEKIKNNEEQISENENKTLKRGTNFETQSIDQPQEIPGDSLKSITYNVDLNDATFKLENFEKKAKEIGNTLILLGKSLIDGKIPIDNNPVTSYNTFSLEFYGFVKKLNENYIDREWSIQEVKRIIIDLQEKSRLDDEMKKKVKQVLNNVENIQNSLNENDLILNRIKNICNVYENEIISTDCSKSEWFINLYNEEHVLNKIIKSIVLGKNDEANDSDQFDLLDEIEEILQKLDFDVKESRDFCRTINKGRLYFREEQIINNGLNEKIVAINDGENKGNIKSEFKDSNIEIKGNEDSSEIEIETDQLLEVENKTTEKVSEDDNTSVNVDESVKVIDELDIQDRNEKSIIESSNIPIRDSKSKIPLEKIVEKNKNTPPNSEDKFNKTELHSHINVEAKPDVDHNTIIYNLLQIDEIGLAFHLAKCYENIDKKIAIPSVILENYLLSKHLTNSTGSLKEKIQKNFLYFNENSSGKNISIIQNLFILAATLRPTFIAYENTSAGGIMHDIRIEGFPVLNLLKKEIFDFISHRGMGIDYLTIRGQLTNAVKIDVEKTKLLEKIDEWSNKVLYRKGRHPILTTWTSWVKGDGWLTKTLKEFIEKKDFNLLDKLLTNNLEDKKWEKRFEDDFKRLMNKKKIEKNGPFFHQISTQIDELIEIINQLTNLNEREINKKNKATDSEMQSFFARVINLIDLSIEEIQSNESHEIRINIALKYLNNSLIDLKNLLQYNETDKSQTYKEIIFSSLQKINFYDSDIDWSPVSHDQELVDQIALFSMRRDTSNDEIIKIHRENRNLESLHRFLSLVGQDRFEDIDEAFINDVKKEIDHLQLNCKLAIDEGFFKGYFNEDKRLRLISDIDSQIEGIRFRNEFPNLPLIESRTKKIKAGIEQLKNIEISQRKREINDFPELQNIPILLEMIENGNIRNFDDYKDRALRGEVFHASSVNNVFEVFFNNFIDAYSKINFETVLNALTKGIPINGFQFNIENEHKQREAIDMIESWQVLKFWDRYKNSENIWERLKNILENIGFKVIGTESNEKSRNWYYFDITCKPIQNKDLCPLPHYGSSSKGLYRIICMWNVSTEEDLVDDIIDLSPATNRSIIVLSFTRMSKSQRFSLANYCKKNKVNFLVLDELLLLFLATTSGSRLPVFFKLSLPFTYQVPYQTDASNLPVEMFYGRREEVHQIRNIVGKNSCFLYGGRQLGKTVLLREVKRMVNVPAEKSFGIYIDLKSKGIGHERPIEDFASVLYEELNVVIPDLFNKKTFNITNINTLLGYLKDWFIENSDGQIILFLDEADKFLIQDANKDFAFSSYIKGLMEETEKRFKVVFAGLHNVRRSTEIPNHPLAHLGESICVGPLSAGSDAREAELLVRNPIESLGFKFESDDLILSILSFSNWYPSLIQIVCSNLLTHMYRKWTPNQMPIIIMNLDILEATRMSINRVKEKFALTLGLDERYDLLANIIAFETLEKTEYRNDGVNLSVITQSAIFYWAEGFESTNANSDVENLLVEMVDLGILRIVLPKNFAMRTPNLIDLIGNREQIEENLTKNRIKEIEFKPKISRIIYKNKGDIRDLRSSITADQFSKLTDEKSKVVILLGSRNLGIEYIDPFLRNRGEISVHHFVSNDPLKIPDYAAELKKITKKKNILLVNTPKVTFKIIEDTNKRIKNKIDIFSTFLLNPESVWDLINNGYSFELLENLGITVLSIPKWNEIIIREWYKDTGCISANLDEIIEVAGTWHKLLDDFHKRIINKSETWKEELNAFDYYLKQNSSSSIADFGLINNDILTVVQQLISLEGALDEVTLDEIVEIIDGITPEQTKKVINYMLRLSIINNKLVVDPIIKKMISNE